MHALMRELLALLERGTVERFRVPATAIPAIDGALVRAATAADAELQLAEAVKLIVALRQSLESPGAAQVLRARIRAVPSARAWMRRLAPRPGEAQRRFRAQQGLAAPARAPVVGTAAPPGSIRATRIIDPSGVDRARAQTRNNKSAPGPSRPRGVK